MGYHTRDKDDRFVIDAINTFQLEQFSNKRSFHYPVILILRSRAVPSTSARGFLKKINCLNRQDFDCNMVVRSNCFFDELHLDTKLHLDCPLPHRSCAGVPKSRSITFWPSIPRAVLQKDAAGSTADCCGGQNNARVHG
jgi:hypothetical protein